MLICISGIIQEPKEQSETKLEKDKSHFNFRFFKVRRTTLIITTIGLLVFMLTIFCMKQQNDYSFLNKEYCKQSIVVREMQEVVDSLRNTLKICPVGN